MTDEPENLVLTMLRRLDTKVDRLGEDVREMKGRMRGLDVLRQDVRLIRAAVNDIARTEVTSGEVEALHHDVNKLQQSVAELEVRLEAVEGLTPR